MPLVDLGLINLIPDPCDFDFHLREQMMSMAKARSAAMQFDPKNDARLHKLMEEDNRRSMMLMPPDAMRRKLRELMPHLDDGQADAAMRYTELTREEDPLAILQEGSLEGGKEGGQMTMFKLAPNFEITMYLALATGACIVTDSPSRWTEVKRDHSSAIQGGDSRSRRACERHRGFEIRLSSERDGRRRRCLGKDRRRLP
jgi:hypothetical protein